jgi:hypothetical protein
LREGLTVTFPDVMARTLTDRVRRLRWRRQIARAAAEVRRSAEQGDLDPRVADCLRHHLLVLDDDIGGGERAS